jgi:hypothetical protein
MAFLLGSLRSTRGMSCWIIFLNATFGLVIKVFRVKVLLSIFIRLTGLGVGVCWHTPEAKHTAAS